jgi:hypothetical protein
MKTTMFATHWALGGALLIAVWMTTGFATPAPTALTIIRDSGPANQVTLRWQGSGGLYQIYRNTDVHIDLQSPPFTTTALNFYTDPLGLTPPYFYVVTADDGSGESLPSNEVGYTATTSMSATGVNWTPFGLAFKTWNAPGGIPTYNSPSTDPSDIFRNPLPCGTLSTADRIVRQDNGDFGYRNTLCNWTGGLAFNHSVIAGSSYFVFIRSTHPGITLVVAGEVDTVNSYASVPIPDPGVPGTQSAMPYSWRDARVRSRDELELLAQGFMGGPTFATSDRVVSQGSDCFGCVFWYNTTTSSWEGTLTEVTPGIAYWIENNHSGSAWTYNYGFSDNP